MNEKSINFGDFHGRSASTFSKMVTPILEKYLVISDFLKVRYSFSFFTTVPLSLSHQKSSKVTSDILFIVYSKVLVNIPFLIITAQTMKFSIKM